MSANFKESAIGLMKAIGKIGFGLFALKLYSETDSGKRDMRAICCKYGYSDAIDVIANSDMFDSHKAKAIELLKKDGDTEYYKSVIKIIETDMFDSKKITAIETISK